jgi:hypothetical protein
MTLAKASLSCDCSFIVLATVITIVNYDRRTFKVQATGSTGNKSECEINLIKRG